MNEFKDVCFQPIQDSESTPDTFKSLQKGFKILTLIIPAIYDKLISTGFKCPSKHYKEYSLFLLFAPSIFVLLLTVLLIANYIKIKRNSLKKTKIKKRVIFLIFISLASVVITFGITFQNTKYYSCFAVGPESDQDRNSSSKESETISYSIGYICFLSAFMIIFIYIFMDRHPKSNENNRFSKKFKKRVVHFHKVIQEELLREIAQMRVKAIYADCYERLKKPYTDYVEDEILAKLIEKRECQY